jgi:hypothetical protein
MKELEIQLKRFAVVLRDVVEPLVYPAAAPLEAHAAVFADIKATPPTPDEALKLTFQPVKTGWRWGPKWATAWFKVRGAVPKDFAGKRVVLRFSTATEGLVWRKDKAGWSPVHASSTRPKAASTSTSLSKPRATIPSASPDSSGTTPKSTPGGAATLPVASTAAKSRCLTTKPGCSASVSPSRLVF